MIAVECDHGLTLHATLFETWSRARGFPGHGCFSCTRRYLSPVAFPKYSLS